jgi:RNA polymerase sigma-70 factor, ECF subfamily
LSAPVAAVGHVAVVSANRTAVVRELVEKESSALLDYFLRRTSDREDAADLLGETLLVIWRREGSIPTDPVNARMWMFGVARNVLSGHRRSRRRRFALAERLAATLPVAESEPELDGVRAAIATLPEVDRELVRLVYWDGFTLAEAAQMLHMRPATVRSRMARAREKLREHLG